MMSDTSNTAALLAHPAHRTNRYALPGARVHRILDGFAAVSEPSNPSSWFGHRLVIPRSPFVDGLDAWLARWSRAHAGLPSRPPKAYLTWATAVRDVDAEASGVRAGVPVDVLRLRVIRRPPAAPPAPSVDMIFRSLASDADWQAAAELNGRVFGADAAQRSFASWAVTSRRARVEAGKGIEWGAFVDGALAGHLGLMLSGGEGRFQDVATAPEWQGHKVIANLLARALTRFFADGGHAAWILADVDSRPDAIYAAAGFEQHSWVYELGMDVPEGAR